MRMIPPPPPPPPPSSSSPSSSTITTTITKTTANLTLKWQKYLSVLNTTSYECIQTT